MMLTDAQGVRILAYSKKTAASTSGIMKALRGVDSTQSYGTRLLRYRHPSPKVLTLANSLHASPIDTLKLQIDN